MEIIDELNRNKAEVLDIFNLPEDRLNLSYAPGKWTIRQLLHHIADAEMVLMERIKRGISKPGQVVWGFNQDAWCLKLEYQNMPLELSKNTFMALRNQSIYFAEKYFLSTGSNSYVHSETGLRTVKDEMEKIVWHADHHLAQIEKALLK